MDKGWKKYFICKQYFRANSNVSMAHCLFADFFTNSNTRNLRVYLLHYAQILWQS